MVEEGGVGQIKKKGEKSDVKTGSEKKKKRQ